MLRSSLAAGIIAVISLSGATYAAAVAQPTPAPKATETPLFTYSGIVRAFYFGRTNGDTCLTCKVKGSPNSTALNVGGYLHGQINIPHSPWALGATYFGADPFNTNAPGPLNNAGYNPMVDNTLPGYPLSIFGETYVQYKSPGTFGQTGKMILRPSQAPWANWADTRITPTAFQGTLLNTNLTPNLNVGAMYMARFRSRAESAFNSNTLLTSCNVANPTGKGPVEGVKGTFTVPGDLCNKQQTTHGFSQFSASYIFGHSGLVANAYQYQVYDITNMTWLTVQYNFMKKSAVNPYVAGHFLGEDNTGQSFVGIVHSHTWGALLGATINHNLSATVGYDGSPFTTNVVLTKNCGTAPSPAAPSPGVIFGGVADTSNTSLPKGFVTCYGGAIVSPYTDIYTSDPLYTTSLTQGLVEVHKPGTVVKAVLTWLSNDRRLKIISSNAWYDYTLPGSAGGVGNADSRSEFDFDVQYFLNRVPANGTYKGLSIRHRYGDRIQPFAPFEFKSSRTQLEYTF